MPRSHISQKESITPNLMTEAFANTHQVPIYQIREWIAVTLHGQAVTATS